VEEVSMTAQSMQEPVPNKVLQLWGVEKPDGSLVFGAIAKTDIEAMAMAAKEIHGGSSAAKLGKLLQEGYRAVRVKVEILK
jgi:hypothetical protein